MRVEELRQDLVLGFRSLRAAPGYSLIVVLTVGLGIAATTTIVSFMTPYLIRELPFENPARLVQIGQVDPVSGWDSARLSLPMFRDWEERTRSFEALGTYYYTTKNVTGAEGPERILAGVLSPNLFDVLGVEAELGRTFGPEDEGVVLLDHGLWLRRYGGDPAVLGRSMILDGAPHVVLGVMPRDFNFPFGGVKMWVPLPPGAGAEPRDRDLHIPVGRLKPEVTAESARVELEGIQRELAAVYPDVDGRFSGVTVKPMREALNFAYDVMEKSFVVLLAAVSFVLLIACVNVASLTLARTTARSREVAVRSALGARRSRLVRQLLVESLLLAVAGGALGTLLAFWGARALGPVIPEDIFRVGEVGVDSTALLFSLALTLLTPLAFGLAPALHASRLDLAGALNASGRSGAGLAAVRWRRRLVVAEIAMAIVLVGATGLMLRSFLALQDVDLGFRPHSVVTVEITLPERGYPDHERQQSYFERAVSELEALPGVRAAAAVAPLPMNHALWSTSFAPARRAPAAGEDWPQAREFRVSPGYFDAMGIPLREGRAIAEGDGLDAPRVVQVSRSLAERHWPGRSPIGKAILIGDPTAPETASVVGVVADVKHEGFEDENPIQVYRALAQSGSRGRFLLVAAEGATEAVSGPVREALHRLDPDLPVTLRPMTDIVGESMLQWSVSSMLLGIFGLAALALASLGIYGVVSYSVASRRREMGLRMALGATGGEVSRLVLAEGLKLAGLGLGIGLALAAVAAKLIASMLYGVGPFDLLTFLAVTAIFLGTATLATLLPAGRAARTDPIVVLRYE
jgi:putative ABC transport system permease protein